MFSTAMAENPPGDQSQNRNISIDTKSMSLLALIEFLQKEHSANIVLSEKVMKIAANVSVPAMKLNKVSVSDILNSVAKLKNFKNSNLSITASKDSSIITIEQKEPKDSPKDSGDDPFAEDPFSMPGFDLPEDKRGVDPFGDTKAKLNHRLFDISNIAQQFSGRLKPTQVPSLFSEILPSAKMTMHLHEETGSLLVKGIKNDLDSLKRLIHFLDNNSYSSSRRGAIFENEKKDFISRQTVITESNFVVFLSEKDNTEENVKKIISLIIFLEKSAKVKASHKYIKEVGVISVSGNLELISLLDQMELLKKLK